MNLRHTLLGAFAALIPVMSYAQSSAPHCALPGEAVTMDTTGDAQFIVFH